ncbi:MAG TPA: lysine biosynthesis protein LysX [Thermoplasmata archaeon]|nr:lysine biosynthesis protein LysX [Thermoplasmata archaeon]
MRLAKRRTGGSSTFTLGLFYTVIRPEEKWILEAAANRGIPVERLHDEAVTFPLVRNGFTSDLVLNRSVSHSRSLYALRFFEHYGVPTVNAYDVVQVCGDKVLASLRLSEAGIPTPKTVVALTPEAALKALDEIGYPAVLKPPVGSWGRLMAKVDDAEEAEQIIEHKTALGSPMHSIFYVQEYVAKPQRDLRAFVVGDELVAAMYRYSDDWRTNASRGGIAEALTPTPEMADLAMRAASAVGGGVLAVDLMESPDGLVVHEVNPTPEFKALASATGIDIAGKIVDYVAEVARR